MRNKLLFAVLLFVSVNVFSQESKFSLELNYPIPIDNNFVGKYYNGIIDAGAKYRFADIPVFNLGASLNAGILKDSDEFKDGSNLNVTAYLIQPRLFAELDLKPVQKLHPSIGAGYTVMIFHASQNIGIGDGEASNTESGINLNISLAYDITSALFIQGQYDFIRLGTADGISGDNFNKNVSLLKFGLGYRL